MPEKASDGWLEGGKRWASGGAKRVAQKAVNPASDCREGPPAPGLGLGVDRSLPHAPPVFHPSVSSAGRSSAALFAAAQGEGSSGPEKCSLIQFGSLVLDTEVSVHTKLQAGVAVPAAPALLQLPASPRDGGATSTRATDDGLCFSLSFSHPLPFFFFVFAAPVIVAVVSCFSHCDAGQTLAPWLLHLQCLPTLGTLRRHVRILPPSLASLALLARRVPSAPPKRGREDGWLSWPWALPTRRSASWANL